jgi:hypothetical protein
MKSKESKAKLIRYINYFSLLLSDNPFAPSTRLSSLGGKETHRIQYRVNLQLCFNLDNNNCVL